MPTTTWRAGRADVWIPATLLALGSAMFLGAGRLHPRIGPALGAVGSDEFFRAFAAEVLHVPSWETMHTLILAGPVLWALAAFGVARLVPTGASALADLGKGALLLGAAFWAVGFVLDGFVTPVHARTVTAAGVASDATALAAFRVTQLTMARLGMVSVVLVGLSVLAFAAALLQGARALAWRSVVGGAGLLIGAWPVIAALRGEFYPGPFTSPDWNWIALSLGVWFLALASALPGLVGTAARHPVDGRVRVTPELGIG